jgi:hypothetical protein
MRLRSFWGRAGFCAILLIALASPAFAQGEMGRISGIVKDQSGLAVPGVTVVVKNEKTGQARETVSGSEGRYAITNLPASVYTVRAALAGFATTEIVSSQLFPGQEVILNIELKPAGVAEQVTVTADTTVLDTSSARMGTNVIEREVMQLPINGRQLSQLYLQAPGSVNSGSGTFGDIRFSGRAVQQNAIRYDGIEGSAIIDASPGNLNGEIPSPFRLQSSLENVQEFRVDSNTYPAEFGTGTGGQVSVVTKSGTNRVRGGAFEYYRNDRFDSRNAFDLGKSVLRLHQFGGSVGGPIARDRAFFFGSYEEYRLDAGINVIEAVPSAAAWSRAVPAVLPLRNAFVGPGAVLLPGASTNPDFDIAQLQGLSTVRERAFSLRLDQKLSNNWTMFGRVFTDSGRNDAPEGVTGRVTKVRARPRNAVVTIQGLVSSSTLNELRVGYNAANTDVNGVVPVNPAFDLSASTINISGSIANTGIAGQGNSSGVAVPGGLVRANSATNGRGAPYRPYSLSIIDSFTTTRDRHMLKFGGEYRQIRMETDRLGGTTYTYSNLNDFLANRISSIQYLGDVSEPSAFNGGATGLRKAQQEYYIAYAQDEWHVTSQLTLNYGLRYEYYAPLREARDLDVLFDVDRGILKPSSDPFFHSSKNNYQPRVSMTWAPGGGRTVVRGGYALVVGPGQTEDQIQPIESDRISSTLSSGAFPLDIAATRANFLANPNNRLFQPRAYANEYRIPERIHQYSVSVQRELPGRFVATVAYVGSQGRNLFLRSVTNQIVEVRTNPNPASNAIVIREFDIVNADGSVLRPFAEVDYKTTGGRDSYNGLQTQLVRRFNTGVTLNAQYTLGRSFGNTAGSNEALTAANNARDLADFDYDLGYNTFDVRHTFNLSALLNLPFGRGHKFGTEWGGLTQALLGGWEIGGIVNARSGLPIQVQVVRPDVVYVDATGNVFGSPAAGRTAVVNTPGGGNSRNVRRPNLVPGVSPYLKDGTLWLNPAAFSMPAPGEFGNLQRGSIRGPSFKQIDLLISKHVDLSGSQGFEFRIEVFNLFNETNYANPPASLPNVLGTGTNQLQPNQPYTAAAAGTFGKLTSTVGRTVGLGTSRQVQFAVRINF